MKKYIFILADGFGIQAVQYFNGFSYHGQERSGIQTSLVSSGAMVLEGEEEAQYTSEQILKLHPSYSVIWCPIESRTIDILS